MSSLATLARSSLKQFTTILAEVHRDHGWNVSGEQLETLMWDKIVAGAPEGKTSKIPSTLLKKMKIQLPYMPEIVNYIGCGAIKPCGGLYVPCGGKCLEGAPFCGTCVKSDAKFGTIADRGAPGTYTDPQDKREISYGTWLAKQELRIEDVHEMLHEQGFTFRIPEEYLTVNAKRAAPPKRRPGRPGTVKKTVVNDDGSESPQGTSMDGFEHKVILSKGHESEVSALSDDDECPCHPENIVAAAVAARKSEVEHYADTVTAAFKAIDLSKVKKLTKEEKAHAKELSDQVKAAAKEVKESEKKEKEIKKAREKAAKELASAEKELAAAEKPKKEPKAPKKETSPKARPAPSRRKESPKALEPEASDTEDEEIVIDGKEYIMRGDNVFDDEGTLRGIKVGGKIEWNA